MSRTEKEADNKEVKNTFVVSCHDLQVVLPVPRGNVSTFYFESKLIAFNLTISELAKDSCECFVWHKVEGSRGANEIGSCALNYLRNKSEAVNDDNLEFYADTFAASKKTN